MSKGSDSRLDNLRRKLREKGSKLSPAAAKLADAAFGASAGEMSHDECRAELSAYAEAKIGGTLSAEGFERVQQHIDTCKDCAELYADLLEIMRAEQAGQISTPQAIPSPSLPFLHPKSVPEPAWSIQPLTPAERLRKYVEETAAKVLTVIAPNQMASLEFIVEPFFEQVDLLGGQFVLQPLAARALGFEGGEADEALTILAATFAATNTLINSLNPKQLDELAAENRLCGRIEEVAQSAALTIQVEKLTAHRFAQQFAQTTCEDPGILRALLADRDA